MSESAGAGMREKTIPHHRQHAPDPAVSATKSAQKPGQKNKSERLQELIGEMENIPDPRMRQTMMETVREIVNFYGDGLQRIFTTLSEAGNSAAKIVYRDMSEDPFLCGLMLIHDLHPLSLQERMDKALSQVRPYMTSHGGGVEVLSLEGGNAKLRFSGSCDGCPSSQVTLELALKRAIEKNCPDLVGLEVEGVDADGSPLNGASKTTLGWKEVQGPERIADGKMETLEVDDVPLLICRVGGELYAFRNLCPGCDRIFSSGRLEQNKLTCKLGHAFDVTKAGKAIDDPAMHLSPFPLLQENGKVKIAVG